MKEYEAAARRDYQANRATCMKAGFTEEDWVLSAKISAGEIELRPACMSETTDPSKAEPSNNPLWNDAYEAEQPKPTEWVAGMPADQPVTTHAQMNAIVDDVMEKSFPGFKANKAQRIAAQAKSLPPKSAEPKPQAAPKAKRSKEHDAAIEAGRVQCENAMRMLMHAAMSPAQMAMIF
jgi:hypothetical protein